jgi:hypothetical protein
VKKITLFSMFGLAFALLQVTNVGAQSPGYSPGTAPQLPRGDAPDVSGSSYNPNQPVSQGGINGVMDESRASTQDHLGISPGDPGYER